MKRTQVMGGLLAAVALCCIAGPGVLLGGKNRGGGGASKDLPPTPINYGLATFGPLPGGDLTVPSAMNSSTEIVGVSRINNLTHAFLYSYATDTLIELNDQFGPANDNLTAPDGSSFAFDGQNGWLVTNASDINDSGQIVCTLDNFSGGTSQATVDARYTPASTNAPARRDFLDPGAASAINNQGDIVGGGFLWTDTYVDQNGWLIAKPLPHASIDVNDRNTSGQVQIIGDNRRYTVDVTTVDANTLDVTDDFDIGTLSQKGNVYSITNYEKCINNLGDVAAFNHVIWYSQGQAYESYRYRDGDGLVLLGSPGGNVAFSSCMNNFGDIAGGYETSTGAWHAYLYSDAFGGMTDLSDLFPGVSLFDGSYGPAGLNDSGDVCGNLPGTAAAYLLIAQP